MFRFMSWNPIKLSFMAFKSSEDLRVESWVMLWLFFNFDVNRWAAYHSTDGNPADETQLLLLGQSRQQN